MTTPAATTPLTDLWFDKGFRVPLYLTAEQDAILRANAQYTHFKRLGCPVCRGAGSHVWRGEVLPCPDDSFGHAAERLINWYWVHNIPFQYQRLDFAEWPTDATDTKLNAWEDAQGYLAAFDDLQLDGAGVTIFSPELGTGKTWLATAIQKELAKRGVDTWFMPFNEVVSLYQEEDRWTKRMLRGRIQGSAVLVLDEVKLGGSADQRRLYREKLEELIRPRTDANLATIVTTNLTDEELEEHYGRVFSLLSRVNELISLEGEPDAREGLLDEIKRRARLGERPPIT